MSVPTWEQYMTPSLRVLSDGEVHRLRHIVEAAADLLGVAPEQRKILNPFGQEQYLNRGQWALSYLVSVKAVERPMRGNYRITDLGRKLLDQYPNGLTAKDLQGLPGYPDGRKPSQKGSKGSTDTEPPVLDPEEQIAEGVTRINTAVAQQLLERIMDQDPVFFEQAVLDLLIAMGYGGAEGRATGTQLSHDGGIDGIIDQDALGLSRIYVQAKRYAADKSVGREAIQAFVGALAGNQATQGVFITTSRFAKTAVDYAGSVSSRVILIDGDRLTQLMMRYGVGVQVKDRIEILEIDEDFFE